MQATSMPLPERRIPARGANFVTFLPLNTPLDRFNRGTSVAQPEVSMKSAMALLCSMALTAPGQRDDARTRFIAALGQIQTKIVEAQKAGAPFSRKSRVDQADLLMKAGVRTAMFDLEGLGRMYREHKKEDVSKFGEWIYKKSKDVEDALGQFDKYQSTGMDDEMKKAASDAMAVMTDDDWIDGSQTGGIFDKILNKIDKVEWPSEKKNREFLLQSLADHMKHIQNTDYDMSLLEQGMHQLRRDLRWIPIYAKVFNGLLKKTNKSCPQDDLPFSKFADPKYSGLPVNPGVDDPCEVSACLWEEINGTVGAFGKLKDQAEKIRSKDRKLLETDDMPRSVQNDAERMYETLKDSKLLKTTRKQIEACLE
jgi:hypothetical protein